MAEEYTPPIYLSQVASSNDDPRSGDLARYSMPMMRRAFATLGSTMTATIRSSFAGFRRTNDPDPLTALSARTRRKARRNDTEAYNALVTLFRGQMAGNPSYTRHSFRDTTPESLATFLDNQRTTQASTAAGSIRTWLNYPSTDNLRAAVRDFMSYSNVEMKTILAIEKRVPLDVPTPTPTIRDHTSAGAGSTV
ncbi:hypothetical protein BCR39DRAFT_505254 [Naematelia encephala]|uniref:Uncharacterized protein n=1 Tax=Naematelia encephala TaxID=71784 RepID=A0A1Y2B6B5_9TREE|nr:hypothetical protein BCR39DRAFT_505254 [Naematelia encephala]